MRYEYKKIHTTSEMSESQLNLLDKQGWELVSVVFIKNIVLENIFYLSYYQILSQQILKHHQRIFYKPFY